MFRCAGHGISHVAIITEETSTQQAVHACRARYVLEQTLGVPLERMASSAGSTPKDSPNEELENGA